MKIVKIFVLVFLVCFIMFSLSFVRAVENDNLITNENNVQRVYDVEGRTYDSRFEMLESGQIMNAEEIASQESPYAKGYIVEFEKPSLIKRKDELKKTAESNKDNFFADVPFVKSFLVTEANIDSRMSSYSKELDSDKERIKARILQKNSVITGKAVREESSKKIITQEYKNVFNGLAVEVSEEEAKEIEKIPGVKKVWPNMKVQATLRDSVPLIQDGILAGKLDEDGRDCRVSGKQCLTGANVTIAILDTGVDYTHGDLGNCTEQQFLAGSCGKVIGGYDFINNDNNPMDDHGHGTHCAGIAAGNGILKGVAPDVKILAYKVLNSSAFGYWSQIIAGIDRASETKAEVISLSLGGSGNPDDPVSQAVDNAVLDGKIVVVAAGNSGPNEKTIWSPGTARKAITVGATDRYDYLAYFSSKGPVVWTNSGGNEEILIKPDVVAPGVNICSSQYGPAWNNRLCVDDNHVAISGTSMATPHIAGVAALMKQIHPDWSPEKIKTGLKATAIDLGFSPNEQGAGRVNVSAVIRSELQVITCINFTYSEWGQCMNGTQTRTIISREPENCVGGEPALSQNCSVDSSCFSSDGFDISNQGYVEYNQARYEDRCVSWNQVKEYYCSFNLWQMKRVPKESIKTCVNECVDGVCIAQGAEERVCNDDDVKNDVAVFGKVVFKGQDYADKCEENGQSVRQYYCEGEKLRNFVKRCLEGSYCNNGVCL